MYKFSQTISLSCLYQFVQTWRGCPFSISSIKLDWEQAVTSQPCLHSLIKTYYIYIYIVIFGIYTRCQ